MTYDLFAWNSASRWDRNFLPQSLQTNDMAVASPSTLVTLGPAASSANNSSKSVSWFFSNQSIASGTSIKG